MRWKLCSINTKPNWVSQLLLPNTASMYVYVWPEVHCFTWQWRQQFPLLYVGTFLSDYMVPHPHKTLMFSVLLFYIPLALPSLHRRTVFPRQWELMLTEYLPANSIIYVLHHPVKHLDKMQVGVSRHLFSELPMQYLQEDIFSYLQLTYLKHNKSDSLLVDHRICNWSGSITLASCVDCMAVRVFLKQFQAVSRKHYQRQ
jgi:hypothetical protein